MEIVKPLALIENDIAQVHLSRLAMTLLLLATIFLVVFVVLAPPFIAPDFGAAGRRENFGRSRFGAPRPGPGNR